jgi:prepilin-type N-terminal cleavage/methylation domain-containing protein
VKRKEKGFTLIELTIFIVVVSMISGWVINLVWLVRHAEDTLLAAITLKIILRVIGVFVPPLGAVMGFFG